MNNSSSYGDLHNWLVTDPTSFWQGQAEAIHWQTPFYTVCDFNNPPFVRWFVGGKTNLCYNAVDRHLETRGETATKQNGRSHGQPIYETYAAWQRDPLNFWAKRPKRLIRSKRRKKFLMPKRAFTGVGSPMRPATPVGMHWIVM